MLSISSKLAVLTVVMLLLCNVEAFWRLPCQGRTALARIDPLVNYGVIADHAHAIHGGANFHFTSLHDDLLDSSCTSCQVKQDKSAYWTPALYYMDANGTTELVPEVGGMLAYYLLYGQDVKAFPDGFTMIAGDTNLRNFSWPVPDPPKSEWSGDQVSQFALAQKSLGFNCLNYKKAPEPSLYRHFLPDYDYTIGNCPDGIRFELMFPSCWDGKNVDSKNHKSHMAYPSTNGTCPDGFGTRLVTLFYETIWDTHAFAGRSGGQFVLGNGDPTGYGYHGDFINAWDKGFLQKAVDTCTNDSGLTSDCPLFNLQSETEQKKCIAKTPKELDDDDCAGPRAGLPGKVPVHAGPAPANKDGPMAQQATAVSTSPKKDAKASSTPSSSAAASSTVVPVLSYSSVASTLQYDVSSSASSSPVATSSLTITASPSSTGQVSGGSSLKAVSTALVTKGNDVWEVVVVEEDITVTAGYVATTTVGTGGAAGGSVGRRHHHHHGRRH